LKKLIIIIGVIGFVAVNWLIKAIEFSIFKIFDLEIAAVLMFLASFLSRYLIILAYDKIKIDWLLIEHLKEKIFKNQEDNENNYVTNKILKWRNNGDRTLLIGLVSFDPTVAAIYYRKGHHKWNNIPKGTRKIFVISVIICTTSLFALFLFFEGSITELLFWLWKQIVWLFNFIF
jgi:hypothetical protein